MTIFFCGYLHNANAHVYSIRAAGHKTYDRIVIEMSSKYKTKIYMLSKPYRVVIDLPRTTWSKNLSQITTKISNVKKITFGVLNHTTVRLVAELKAPAHLKHPFYLDPKSRFSKTKHWRVVVDLIHTSKSKYVTNKIPSTKTAKKTTTHHVVRHIKKSVTHSKTSHSKTSHSRTKTVKAKKFVVMLDPGHGGIDSGTISTIYRSLWEKNVNLDIAKRVYTLLAKDHRFTPRITRSKDYFIPLVKRISINHNAHSDLFISFHCDAASNHNARGATIFSLGQRGKNQVLSRNVRRLMDKEDNADLVGGGVNIKDYGKHVGGIMFDLTQRKMMSFSQQFASMIQSQFKSHKIRLKTRSYEQANFAVLKAQDVPSVLIEMGYLSNHYDAKDLRAALGRQKRAIAVVNAIKLFYSKNHTALGK